MFRHRAREDSCGAGTRVASELRIPIIGIGAGGGVDGQVLVIHDMLGINKGFSPRFLRRYADLHEVMTGAVTSYVEDVKSGDFPNDVGVNIRKLRVFIILFYVYRKFPTELPIFFVMSCFLRTDA